MKTLLHLPIILFLLNLHPNKEESRSDFKLVRESKGIRLYSREKVLTNGNSTRELKAEFYVSASGHKLLEPLRNESYLQLWMNGTKRIYMLNESPKCTWYTYVEYQLPWPFLNQDCIIKYSLLSQSTGYTLYFESIPDYLPTKIGVERIVHMEGQWEITIENDEICRVTYRIYTEDRAKYPRWLADPIVQNNLINSLFSMKTLTEKLALTSNSPNCNPNKMG